MTNDSQRDERKTTLPPLPTILWCCQRKISFIDLYENFGLGALQSYHIESSQVTHLSERFRLGINLRHRAKGATTLTCSAREEGEASDIQGSMDGKPGGEV